MIQTKGELAFIGCGSSASFIFEKLELAADRGYGVVVEPVGTENNRAFNLYQVTPSRARATPALYEALKAIRAEGTRCLDVCQQDAPIRSIYNIEKVDRLARRALAKAEEK